MECTFSYYDALAVVVRRRGPQQSSTKTQRATEMQEVPDHLLVYGSSLAARYDA